MEGKRREGNRSLLNLVFTTILGPTLSLKLARLAGVFTLGTHWPVFAALFGGSVACIFLFWFTTYCTNPESKLWRFLTFAWTCGLAISPYASFQIGLYVANLLYKGVWPYEAWAVGLAFIYFVFVTVVALILVTLSWL